MSEPTLIKKYSNRRLYDTGDSRYVTLEELADKVQRGTDVRVIDAQSGDDLTQAVLAQILIEGRGAARMLPVPLLTQLVRLGDDALADFLGDYLSATLALYLQGKQNASAMANINPFARLPFTAADAMARMWNASPFGFRSGETPPMWPPMPVSMPMSMSAPAQPAQPATDDAAARDTQAAKDTADELAALRSELEELKQTVRDQDGARKRRRPRKPKK